MKAYFAIVLGLVLLLAPLWSLSGFATAPEYRTGTITDYSIALTAGATLYCGVLVGVLVGRRSKGRLNGGGPLQSTFIAGMAGAMVTITLVLFAVFLIELISTGRLMPPGQTPALLPIFYVAGGILSALIAAGVGLIAYGFSGALVHPKN